MTYFKILSGGSPVFSRSQHLAGLKRTAFFRESDTGAAFVSTDEIETVFPTLTNPELAKEAAHIVARDRLSWDPSYSSGLGELKESEALKFDDSCSAFDDADERFLVRINYVAQVRDDGSAYELMVDEGSEFHAMLSKYPALCQLIKEAIAVLGAVLAESPTKISVYFMLYRTCGAWGKFTEYHHDSLPAVHIPLWTNGKATCETTYRLNSTKSDEVPTTKVSPGDVPSFNDNRKWEHQVDVHSVDKKCYEDGIRLMMNVRSI